MNMTPLNAMEMDISHLQPNPFQPRDKIKNEDIEELAASIKEHGILEPLVVADTPAGYQIIAGERRWRAAQKAGLTQVPVVIRKVTPSQMLELAMIENVQRTDLNPLERAQAIQQLMREFGLSNLEVAKKLSKSPAFISNSLRLLTLPDAIKDGISSGMITEGHARAIAAITDPRAMVDAYKELLKTQGTVRDAEELARNWRDSQIGKQKLGKRFITRATDPEAKEWEEKLRAIIRRGAWIKSQIKLSRSNTSTKITITLRGSQAETQVALENLMRLTENNVQE